MLSKTLLRGIQEGKHAFSGPRLLQLDITNDCNTNCVGCWCHSDYLGEKKLNHEEKKIRLSVDVVKKIIDAAHEMNIESIQLAGSGEPFMHPHIKDIIAHIKSYDIRLEIVTNGLLLTEEMCSFLVAHNVEQLVVSVWAGTAETYKKTHPNQPLASFDRLQNQLRFLFDCKSKADGFPVVRIYNVISHLNYFEIEAMIDSALAVGANKLEFQAIDVIPGITDDLMLRSHDIAQVEKQIDRIKKRKDFLVVNMFDTDEFSEYGRLVIKKHLTDEFKYYFDHTYFYAAKCCLEKWSTHVEECIEKTNIRFFFNKDICKTCVRCMDCTIDQQKDFSKDVHYMSLVGINTFLRRIRAAQVKKTDEYDTSVKDMPCFVGWDYARILTNGDVIPCCKGYLKPLGNIYKRSFAEVWNSNTYNEFRVKAKTLDKSDPYFAPMECLRGCDNYGRNALIAHQLKVAVFKGIAK